MNPDTQADMTMQSAELYDVIITGCGPVGATLANLLAQQGLSVAVLEREAGVYPLARAGHFDAEIMRVFQSVGIAPEVETATDTTVGMRFLDADGALLMEWRRGGEKGPLGWVSDYMFFQPAVERALRTRMAASPKVRTFLSHDVFAVHDAGGHVEVRAENTANARLVCLHGKYVVGCDGARSLVRRTMGAEHEDLGFKQRWLVVDVLQKHDLGLERISTQHCNPERPMYATCIANGMLRWEIMLKPEDDAAQVTTPEAIWNFIENSVRPISRHDGELHRGVVYTFESLLTDRWRKGRLMVAGDSAHRTPPFLGQGMCAGIRDAANLAWKLAAVCEGKAPETLLDTYEVERRPHVKAFIEGAVEVGKFVQMDDPVKMAEIVRDMRANPKAYAPPNPALGPGLSPHYGTDGLGRQFVQPQVNGQLLDEFIGHSFALLATESFVAAQPELQAVQHEHPRIKLVALPDDLAPVFEPYGAPAVLVRPDRYVHAAVSSAADLAALLRALPVQLR
jgi:3-(3-hydroxy-phenyl)propionate hydroxylase